MQSSVMKSPRLATNQCRLIDPVSSSRKPVHRTSKGIVMFKLVPAVLVALMAAGASAQQLSAPTENADYALYRLAVLKDDSVKLAPAKTSSTDGGRWVLGPQALLSAAQRIFEGRSTRTSAQHRRGADLHRSRRHAAPLQLTQYEMYERSVLRKPEAENMSTEPPSCALERLPALLRRRRVEPALAKGGAASMSTLRRPGSARRPRSLRANDRRSDAKAHRHAACGRSVERSPAAPMRRADRLAELALGC